MLPNSATSPLPAPGGGGDGGGGGGGGGGGAVNPGGDTLRGKHGVNREGHTRLLFML